MRQKRPMAHRRLITLAAAMWIVTVLIAASTAPTFKAAMALKDAVNAEIGA